MSKAAEATELSFEEALGKLESIVETMEDGDLPLEQLLTRYLEGAGLVKFCQERLAAAELRLQQLEPRQDGELAVSPADLRDDTSA